MNPATASVSCLDTEFTDLLAPELLSLGMVVRALELDRLPGRSEAILAAQAAYEAMRKRGGRAPSRFGRCPLAARSLHGRHPRKRSQAVNDKNLMPILFLDIDDVLCLNDKYGGYDVIDALNESHESSDAVFRHIFSRRACDALAHIHDAMEARLRYVISSTWREVFDRDQLCDVFRRGGLGFVASSLHKVWCTPINEPRAARGDDIAQWLDRHLRGEPFAIVDDTFSGFSLEPALTNPSHPFAGRIVLCQETVDLMPEHIDPLLNALRQPLRTQSRELTTPAVRDI
jgi:hypothetical protein